MHIIPLEAAATKNNLVDSEGLRVYKMAMQGVKMEILAGKLRLVYIPVLLRMRLYASGL